MRAWTTRAEDEGKVGFLWELEGAAERLTLLRADLMVEGSFDEAVGGVDGVFHTASPVVVAGGGKDVQGELVDPIVKGAANVLRSCARAPDRARRVVFTSSCSCVRYCHAATLNESHWSDADYCKSYNVRVN
jgi:nucleoside-diphosphate-sugar epimerase